MRRLLTIFFAIFSSLVAWGQSATVSGRVFDAESKEGVVGAVIEVTMPSDTLYRRHYTTGYGGYFKTPPMRVGKYKMLITFLGYTDYTREFEVKGMPLDLGDMAMAQSAIEVAVVVKEVVAPRAKIDGDTVRYNASQFKVTTDAELETLLRKMPGISITNGKIEAQGERVRQIYVDNKEFFGGNVQQVLQSIPAQAVESIEVYNRLSEVSQITGIDDGEGGKVINIVTRGSMSHSEFGKVHGAGGYGADRTPEKGFMSTMNAKMYDHNKGRYSAGGSVNIFRDDMRFSVLALANNLNKQNLSDEGISMSGSTNRSNASSQFSVNRQSGIATAEMLAFNYTDRWGKRKRARFEGTAFFNHSNTRNDYVIDRWYNAPAKPDTIHYDQFSAPENLTLRLRGRLEWKIAKRQRLYLNPAYTYSQNSSINGCDSTSLRLGPSGARFYPSYNDGGGRSHSASIYAQYYYKFLRQGRMFLLTATLSHYDAKDSRDYASTSYAPNTAADKIKWAYSRRPSTNNNSTFRIQPIYRDRIGSYVTLNIYYNFQYQLRNRELFYYDTDHTYEIKDPEAYRKKTSSSYEGVYLFHEAAAGMRYGKGRSWFSLNLQYRNTMLSTTNKWAKEAGDEDHTIKRTYDNFLYNTTLHVAINKGNTLRASASSRMRIPGLWSLNDMWNVGNTSYLSVGNPDLKPSQEYNFLVRYTNLSSKLGTTFMVMGKAMHLSDYMGSKIVYSPGRFKIDGTNYTPIQLTQQVNLDGYWTYEGRMSLGLPFKAIRSNINIELGANYSDIPTEIINMDNVKSTDELFDDDMRFIARGDKVMMHNTNAYAQFTLGSNISENVDFTVTWRGTYSHNTSTLDILDNNYFMHYARANVKAVLPLGFTITSSVNFTHFISFTNKFNDNFTLWNISVGKKVLNNLGEVELCVNDVLNQNTSFGRYVWASYSQLRYNSVLGRTYLVKFTYNIRNLGGQSRRRKSLDVPYDRLADVQSKLNSILKF